MISDLKENSNKQMNEEKKSIQHLNEKFIEEMEILKKYPTEMLAISRAPVAHTYNPSYSGGRDQED
jgi:hypothetical protein